MTDLYVFVCHSLCAIHCVPFKIIRKLQISGSLYNLFNDVYDTISFSSSLQAVSVWKQLTFKKDI